ncbi:hypothetical protein PanNE5_18510 [Pandoraea sp. NE5]|uniref:hypothetical protein n=1 Tax=Pandoraea sp. NE5 TaxID=2904129 RepID=UPI0021C277B4|nr:hypothetical protein [Pandoraea sp. NE5]BDD92411.1 hypothetical protein PanNE5_18510 [Pandoraea sp. NE5]
MTTELEILQEVRDRVVRTESRMVQLGDFVGTNLRVRMHIEVRDVDGDVWVDVDALDVSVSRIYTALEQAGVHGIAVPVRRNGRDIAMVYPQ